MLVKKFSLRRCIKKIFEKLFGHIRKKVRFVSATEANDQHIISPTNFSYGRGINRNQFHSITPLSNPLWVVRENEVNIMDKTKWSERDLEEFEKLCAPLVEFIQQRHDKCNPYSWIIIQWNGVAFMPDSFWFPFKVPD